MVPFSTQWQLNVVLYDVTQTEVQDEALDLAKFVVLENNTGTYPQ